MDEVYTVKRLANAKEKKYNLRHFGRRLIKHANTTNLHRYL